MPLIVCEECDGSGKAADCPDHGPGCGCPLESYYTCEECDGTGELA